MKREIKVLAASLMITLAMASQAQAWIASDPVEKTYTFKFRLAQEVYEYSQKAGSYEEAFEKAAQNCYRHFKGGRRLSEDRGLDIIDVCANPRS